MSVQIQLRRDLAAQWTSVNPTLAEGEVGIETDTGQVKIGSGLSTWTQLAYFGGAGTASVTSTELSAVSAAAAQERSVISAQVVVNSAQMTSADNAISAAVNVVSSAASNALSVANAVSAAVTSVNTVLSNLASDVSANSAQMTSADNAISAAVAALSAQHTSLANSVANFGISELAGVSLAALSDGQVLKWNSAAAQWVNSTDATGGAGGSVTSTELSAVSAAAASADATLSVRIDSVMTVVSNLASDVSANSAQMTSADNAISAAVAAVSADLTSVKAVVSNLASDVSANSAQMTSADNAISAAVAALSAQHTSLANSVANFGISELAGVSLAGLSDGQVLKWNSANAQWVNSTDVTGGGGASVTSAELINVAPYFQVKYAIVSNTQSTNGSALVDVSGLVLTVGANETWKLRGVLLVSTSAIGVGIRIGASVPPLSTPRYFAGGGRSAGQSAGQNNFFGALAVSGASTLASIGTIGPAGAMLGFAFSAMFNTTSSGTFRVMACGIASTAASPLHYMAGSHMIALRLK